MTKGVRQLPSRVRPLPDEPFDSWLEAMAAYHQATFSEMAFALGLLDRTPGGTTSATRQLAAPWSLLLTDRQARLLERTTGLPAEQFHAMTRMHFARRAIRYTRSGRVPAHSAVATTGGRYCPECLQDSGGRWRMSWQFAIGFACARHRRLLADFCSRCERAPRQKAHPLREIPLLGRCHNPAVIGVGPPSSFCRNDLSEGVRVVRALDPVLSAQRSILRTIDTGQASFGIYANAPQPAIRVLDDFRLLARIALKHDDAEIMALAELDDEIVARAREVAGGSAMAAVGYSAALAALADPFRVVKLLRGHIGQATTYNLCSPQLQTLMAASLGRSRRPTSFLQSAPVTDGDPAERARKVPAQMWGDWVTRIAPLRMDRESASIALSAAVVFTGSRLTHSAALALIDPTAPPHLVTRVLRAFDLDLDGEQAGTIQEILRLVNYLDSHNVPIDYARRRALDCHDLLEEATWKRICWVSNVMPGTGPRWRHARGYLYKKLTGSRVCFIDSELSAVQVDRFAEALPAGMRDQLDQVGRDFLDSRRISEPLTWTPELDGSSIPSANQAGLWPLARPAFAAAQDAIPLEDIAVAHATGMSTHELARRVGVSRQTISRILTEISKSHSRGSVEPTLELDVDYIRELYEVQRLTMVQIAKLMNCSAHTIGKRLRTKPHPIPEANDL